MLLREEKLEKLLHGEREGRNRMAKIQTWKGRTEEDVLKMDMQEFLTLIPTRQRRSLNRANHTPEHKKLLRRLAAGEKNIKTHCRNVVITPNMIGQMIKVYNGKEYMLVAVTLEMLGHYLGEFSHSRRLVSHGSAGVGATRSSKTVSAK
jgi:small subunit ribosomal protein S19